jgi:hypothetical protein
MKITAYNQHDVGSFSRALVVSSQPIYSLRRANVVIQSSEAKDLLSLALTRKQILRFAQDDNS